MIVEFDQQDTLRHDMTSSSKDSAPTHGERGNRSKAKYLDLEMSSLASSCRQCCPHNQQFQRTMAA
jgi:hypothetical protein